MNDTTCRISVCVTLEEKRKMLEAASKDDRTLSMWAVRALRVALETPSSAPVAQPRVQLCAYGSSEPAVVPSPPVCRLGFLPDGSVDRGYPDHLLPPEAIAARAAAGWPPKKPDNADGDN